MDSRGRRLGVVVLIALATAGCAPGPAAPPSAVSVAQPAPAVSTPALETPTSAVPAPTKSSGKPAPRPSTVTTTKAAVAKPGFWGDTATIPKAKNVLTVKVLNRTNGKYPDSKVFWSFGGQTHPITERPYLDMPANSAGRMYFHLGSANSKYSDFIEFTVGADQFNGNTTRVDAFVLKIAMRLHAADGFDEQVGETPEVFGESRAATFARFRAAVPA